MRARYFMLFSTCVPVRGAKNSAIYDLSRNKILQFPTEYFDLLSSLNRRRVDEMLMSFRSESVKKKVLRFLDFLLKMELGCYVEDVDRFPGVRREISYRPGIHNAIIDVAETEHDWQSIVTQLDELGCEYLQLRSYSNLIDLNRAREICELLYDRSFRSVELILKAGAFIDECDWIALMLDHKIISRLVVHSARRTTTVNVSERESDERIVEFVGTNISSADCCGFITLETISAPKMDVYLENTMFNGCLNRKISIAADGTIRNCPSMDTSFGSHRSTSLASVVADDDFRGIWNIKKDDIAICRDCEFRYSCTDCRAFTSVSGDRASKPARCGYDPYTGSWANRIAIQLV